MEEEGIGFKARLVSMLLRLMTLGLIAVALMISTEGIVIVVLLFVLVVPFEKLFPRHRGQKVRRPHLDTDVGYALASPLMGLLTGFVAIAIGLLSLAWIPGLLVAPYVAKIPAAYLPVVGFLLFDALVYWTHRFYHEIPVLWKFHAIHHSTEHLDWASGFRAHPLDGTILAPAFVFLTSAQASRSVDRGPCRRSTHSRVVPLRECPLATQVAAPPHHHARISSLASHQRTGCDLDELLHLPAALGPAVRDLLHAEGPASTVLRSE